MTSTPTVSTSQTPPRPRTSVASAGIATLALIASTTALLLGPTEKYALIFPPPWVTLVAVGLLACSYLAARTSPAGLPATVLGWAAAVFFLGGSGGVVLDAFRAFFLVTGIPAGDFDRVDWPGAVARTVSLLAALVAVHHTWRMRAATLRAADVETSAGTRRVLAWAAVVLVIPYPLLKLVWWAQALANPALAEQNMFPGMELLAFGAALVLVLLMLSSRTPPLLGSVLLTGGWVASMALLSMGFLMVFGMLAQLSGLASGAVPFSSDGAAMMVLCVYGTWLMLGVVVLAATLQLMDRRRRTA
ncbi:hypothetical protein ACQEVI_21635 [Promicromonospora sp. CA-289599]|uniref:hypothetical protein n=1 Tax=Promicromonospora sp. CA-289599 TaxID=3240014 RepID=UPI003D8FD1DD